MASSALFISILGGIAPVFIWLYFWLREDRCQPEPLRYIVFTFLAGAAVVAPAFYLEKMAMGYFTGTTLLIAWAFIEEFGKFMAAYWAGLRMAAFDEPLDAVMYLITAALGFAAFENALFLLSPGHTLMQLVVTGDLRFIGATLLHTLSSASVGVAIALSFYKRAALRRAAAAAGVILAVFLHTLFNFFILNSGGDATFWVFLCIWFGIIALLLTIERVKQPGKDYC